MEREQILAWLDEVEEGTPALSGVFSRYMVSKDPTGLIWVKFEAPGPDPGRCSFTVNPCELDRLMLEGYSVDRAFEKIITEYTCPGCRSWHDRSEPGLCGSCRDERVQKLLELADELA